MSPYVESLIYKSEICYRYVSILQNYENWSLDEIKSEMARISELKERVEECTTQVLNKITYDREPTTVDVGVAVINGFIKRVEEICSEDIKPVLGMQSIVYKGFNGIYQGKLEYVFDGDEKHFRLVRRKTAKRRGFTYRSWRTYRDFLYQGFDRQT